MVTIYDVADRAGVSAATVSRVFNGIKVTPERAAAVHRAAAELGFVPNRNARRLRTSSSEIIAMLIPDIENPFFTAMARGVEDVARSAGYSVMLGNTDEEAEREQDYLRVAVSDPVAGIILVPASPQSQLDLAVERGVPLVCVDRRAPGRAADSVVADNVSGGALATRLLVEQGHRRIACISGPVGVDTADERVDGWAKEYLTRNGEPPAAELLVRSSFTVSGGASAARQLMSLPHPPEAILAASNKLATGVIRELSEAGLLPPQIGVASLGGLPLVLLPPEVIQVHLPARELGTTATEMLLERIRGLATPPRETVVPIDSATQQPSDLERV
ncbi:LacI family transcriptional regulator [Propionicimonas paludicola]|uniref:LacI family transcriptional regulator n=1 Tax=Propionicimonas paludicola TaxID=185243 RepID=A0A2A9CNP1_9ACTN|nr:LacI family DNA-binding transcriptional regulator [Propionicimonas paludicola]PFG15766.1 LacI family transcriptional regulator [Propionicimonas paludicola]